MAGAFGDISNSMKENYPQEVVEPMTNDEAPFRAFLKKRNPTQTKNVSEGLVTFIANTISQPSVGQMADGIALPPTMDRTDVRMVLKPTNFVGSIEVGLLTMNAANSNKSAFNGGELARSTNNAISHTAKFIESTYVGTHGTGRRGRVEGGDGTNLFVAALPEGLRLLKEGYYLSGRSTDAGSVSGSFDAQRITKLVDSTRTVTYGGTDRTLTAGDHLHVVTVASQTLTSTFANGLRGLVDDATYLTTVHGQSRATHAKLNSIVNSNGGTLRNLSEQLLVRTAHEVERKSGKKINAIWGPEGQQEKYLEFIAPEKRIITSTNEPGARPLGYKDTFRLYVPGVDAMFYKSFDIVPRELYLLNMDTFFHYVSKELGPLDIDGTLHLSPGSGTFNASVLGYVAAQENIGCEWFEANAVIRDLKDPFCGD
jgi:hypothetical protein